MKKTIAGTLISALFIAGAAWLLYPNTEKSAQARSADGLRAEAAMLEQKPNFAPASSWPGSPFGSGPPASEPAKLVLPAHILTRKTKMTSGGYGAPPEYYEMDLQTLQKRAETGDGYAMLQLAVQYYDEAPRLRSDPSFPKDADPRVLAKQYLADAVGAGFSRAATLLSKYHSEENNIVDAYAWKLVSENLGDGENRLWGRDTNQFASLTAEQKQLASTRSDAVMKALDITRPRVPRRLGISPSG